MTMRSLNAHKPWIRVRSIRFNPRRQLWTTTAKTPGARTHRRLSAPTFPEIIVLYLAHNFDRESLMDAAAMAEPRETMINRVRSITYQTRKEEQPWKTGSM